MIENSKGVVIRRSTEGRKGAATAMDMVQERVNKSTRDTEAVIFVRDQADPTVSRVLWFKPLPSSGLYTPGVPAHQRYFSNRL